VQTSDQQVSVPTSRKVLCAAYAVIAVAALVGTWSQGGPYIHSVTGFLIDFWRDTKVTGASRFITVDILMFCLAAMILMVIEARKHQIRFVWAYIVASLFIAISVMFPVFLLVRELRMGAAEPPRLHTVDAVLLAVFAAALAGLSIWVDAG
jgi:Mn2+/Fe2+ NRAMP family transporter